MKLEFSRQIFEKSTNNKLYENPHNGADLFHADGRTYTRTDMTKLTVAFLAILRTHLKFQSVPHSEHIHYLLNTTIQLLSYLSIWLQITYR